ncbi:hypothetical protein [Pseudomonas sp. ME-P-057]|uniref:hypothetical protein n=1 Tax=Pseudomonas sp. ME-P-057 TaxID=3040321 RepID=UPI0025524B6F|nr:hypothetical protein [Pseudomonas sp. ME-P-057]
MDQYVLKPFVKRTQQRCYLFFTQELRQNVSDTTSQADTPGLAVLRKFLNALAICQPRRKRYLAQQEEDAQAHRKYTLPTGQHPLSAQKRGKHRLSGGNTLPHGG